MTDGAARQGAAQAVRLPALGVIVTGAFWLVVWSGGALYSLARMGGVIPDSSETPPALNLVAQVFFAAVAVVVIVGGMNMRRLRRRGLALTAAVLSLVCGCLPLAVLAIVVLTRSDVAQAFADGAPRTV